MTGRPLSIDIQAEGIDTLADLLINAPEAATAAAGEAGREAIGIIGPAVDAVTNVDTGRLVSNNEFILLDYFTLAYRNFTPYASFVNDRFHFVERGVESVQGQVEDVYERAIDRVVDELFG